MTKLRYGPVQLADIPTNMAISSISHSPMSSLYHTIKSVYQPLLSGETAAPAAGGQKQQKAAGDKVQDLLVQLEAGLGSVLRMGQEVGLLDILNP